MPVVADSKTHLLSHDASVRFSQHRLPDANNFHPSLPRADASHPCHHNIADLNDLVRRSRLLGLRHLRAPGSNVEMISYTSNAYGTSCHGPPVFYHPPSIAATSIGNLRIETVVFTATPTQVQLPQDCTASMAPPSATSGFGGSHPRLRASFACGSCRQTLARRMKTDDPRSG